MDRVIPQNEQRSAKRNKTFKWILIALAVAAIAFYGLRALRPQSSTSDFRFATVDRGTVKSTINAAGLVVPAFEEQLNAPVATTVQKVLLKSGATVKKGDLIMELDREYVALQVDGRKDQLTLKQNNVDLLKLEYDRDLRDLEIDTEVANLELSSAEAQLKDAERLLKIGGATQEDVERAELAVQMARLSREKLANQLAYRKSSDAGKRRQLQLEVSMEEKEVSQLARKLRETAVRAPRNGVITWVEESIGQLVSEGAPLVRIADLGAFRIEGSCSDRYAGQLEIGMPVEVRLPKGTTRGTISRILPEVTNNTLRFLVQLDNEAFEGLRPNMRTELVVITGESADVLRLRNGPAIRGGKRQQLFVVRGDQAVKVPVTLGQRGGDHVEVTSGLSERERVIIGDMEDYMSRETIILKTEKR
ncbi:MAG: efflux RND transporter periplasmic adaptor subunit [Saprospiraceae bacterium]